MISEECAPNRLAGWMRCASHDGLDGLKKILCGFGVLLVCGFSVPAWATDQDLTRQVLEMQSQTRTLENRIAKLEAALLQNQQLLDLLKEVEALKSEVAKLRGQAEVQTHQIDTLEKRQKDLYVDLDRRVSDMAKPSAVAPAAVPPVATVVAPNPSSVSAQTAASVASPPPHLDPMLESRAYEAALNHFKAGNYPGAIASFKGFLKAYPDSALAPNAQYWIGYAYYALRDYRNALAQQQKLLAVYPGSAKVPDALLNVASNQVALNDHAAAKKTLEEIVAKFPGSNAATLAAKRLAILK